MVCQTQLCNGLVYQTADRLGSIEGLAPGLTLGVGDVHSAKGLLRFDHLSSRRDFKPACGNVFINEENLSMPQNISHRGRVYSCLSALQCGSQPCLVLLTTDSPFAYVISTSRFIADCSTVGIQSLS